MSDLAFTVRVVTEIDEHIVNYGSDRHQADLYYQNRVMFECKVKLEYGTSGAFSCHFYQNGNLQKEFMMEQINTHNPKEE